MLQGMFRAGLVCAITHPGLPPLSPSEHLEMWREEFGRLFWISSARGVRRGCKVMGRVGLRRGRAELEKGGLIPAQLPKGSVCEGTLWCCL